VLFGLGGNPVNSVPRIAEFERTSDRALSDYELRAYWNSLARLPLVQQATLRLNLALGQQRPTQLLRAEWKDIDFEKNTLLLRDGKGRGGARDHLLPLTAFALEQLKPLRQLNCHVRDGEIRPSPFSSDGRRAMVVETLSKAVSEVSRTLKEDKGIEPFDQRALRRTAETMLQKLGIDREVRAHLLSHGRSQGVHGVHYERYDFLEEKRRALRKWASYLGGLLEGKPADKVRRLRAA
jgi:integrase